MYAKIYHNQNAVMPDNIAPVITRIRTKMRSELKDLANIEDYIPKLKGGKYVVEARAEMIKIRSSSYEQPADYSGYHWK